MFRGLRFRVQGFRVSGLGSEVIAFGMKGVAGFEI